MTRQAKGVVQNCQIGNHHRNPRRATSGQGFSKHDMQSPNHDLLTTFATVELPCQEYKRLVVISIHKHKCHPAFKSISIWKMLQASNEVQI